MQKNTYNGLIVDPVIKPVSRKKRIAPQLEGGCQYFISFGNNLAFPCTLLKVISEFDETEVKVEWKGKFPEKGVRDFTGALRTHYQLQNTVKAIEIGLTPEDSVRNQVG